MRALHMRGFTAVFLTLVLLLAVTLLRLAALPLAGAAMALDTAADAATRPLTQSAPAEQEAPT